MHNLSHHISGGEPPTSHDHTRLAEALGTRGCGFKSRHADQAKQVEQVGLRAAVLTYDALMGTGAKPRGGVSRRWTRPLVVVGAGLSASAGATINFAEVPTPLRSAALIIFVLLTTALAWYAQPPAIFKKKLCNLTGSVKPSAVCNMARWNLQPSGVIDPFAESQSLASS